VWETCPRFLHGSDLAGNRTACYDTLIRRSTSKPPSQKLCKTEVKDFYNALHPFRPFWNFEIALVCCDLLSLIFDRFYSKAYRCCVRLTCSPSQLFVWLPVSYCHQSGYMTCWPSESWVVTFKFDYLTVQVLSFSLVYGKNQGHKVAYLIPGNCTRVYLTGSHTNFNIWFHTSNDRVTGEPNVEIVEIVFMNHESTNYYGDSIR